MAPQRHTLAQSDARRLRRASGRSGVARIRAAVFLDKDGTLIVDVPYNVDPALIQLAPGAAQGLPLLARKRLPLIVISNQSGIGSGRFGVDALPAVSDRLDALCSALSAPLSDCFYCPHAPAAYRPTGPSNLSASRDTGGPTHASGATRGCGCRKPEPGMLWAAARRHRIDLAESWFVGDILDDVEAAHRAGCRAVLIDNGNETVWRDGPGRRPDAIAKDLHQAARTISGAMRSAAELGQRAKRRALPPRLGGLRPVRALRVPPTPAGRREARHGFAGVHGTAAVDWREPAPLAAVPPRPSSRSAALGAVA